MNVQKDNQFIVTRLEEEMLDVAKQDIYDGGVCFKSINLCNHLAMYCLNLPIRLSLRIVE